jgi:outer membrane biogenesis lipoprotein LolB
MKKSLFLIPLLAAGLISTSLAHAEIDITKAEWKQRDQKLQVRAEEGNGSTELTAFYDGQPYPLKYHEKDERYELRLEPVCYSTTLTVSSSSGASATRNVEARDGDGSGYECSAGTVNPLIEITKAEWKQRDQRLQVRAEEGDGSAELTALYDGQPYLFDYDERDERYELQLEPVCYSTTLTVSSSSGASATRNVEARDGDGSGYECSGIIDPVCPDNDKDGYTDATCGGTDCNDTNGNINPDATEICGDDIDQNCSGADDECSAGTGNPLIEITKAEWKQRDQKLQVRAEEGNGSAELTAFYDGYSYLLDYDEKDARYELQLEPVCYSTTLTVSSSSGASATKNVEARDGDGSGYECSGIIDPVCPDNDKDGYTDATCGGTDCNDTNGNINPDATEICGDDIDQNCSGADANCQTGTHQDITSYDGPATCIACHASAANEMLNSLHMQWAGPTPDLTNTSGEELGKAVNGINTFCTYAMSSGGACFSCHVRADGNAPHAPDVNDVDCLMCHSDTYQRTTVMDPDSGRTVVNILGEERTYFFGAQDGAGNYTTEPNFDTMPAGTTMVDLAKNVHLPTRKSCLRCHAKAGGGDWTKRGDMGLSTANPAFDEDIHMSPAGADLSCQACHATESSHTVGGRGIDLRQTESIAPTCQVCHGVSPHQDSTINRHAAGQVSCQVCHIREFGKGGATEMSRDWLEPHWNPAFCAGQGGFVGHEVKEANVKPEYTWFDGTSYVYNLGEQITPDANGIYHMADANGAAFDGNSKIVPIKRHFTNIPLHESGQIIGPQIMEMFMTGDFDQAVQAGMQDMGLTGSYTMIDADAEMLITHGVDPKAHAPSCVECHDGSGTTTDGAGMLPFTELGYHMFPSDNMCSLCHGSKSMNWQDMHSRHVEVERIDCASCHTVPPNGLTSSSSSLCSSCHGYKSESDPQKIHEKHVKRNISCTTCHTF